MKNGTKISMLKCMETLNLTLELDEETELIQIIYFLKNILNKLSEI